MNFWAQRTMRCCETNVLTNQSDVPRRYVVNVWSKLTAEPVKRSSPEYPAERPLRVKSHCPKLGIRVSFLSAS